MATGHSMPPPLRTRRALLRRIMLAAQIGAPTGAIGALPDCARAAFRSGFGSSDRLELAVGCTIVGAFMGALFGLALAAVWEATDGLGRLLARAWPFVATGLARELPVTALLVVSFASDGVFSGPGISKMTLGIVGRWAFPALGALLVVALLKRALAIHARMQSASRWKRAAGLVVGLAVGASLLRLARLPLLDPYSQLQRYCEAGSFLAIFFGVALFNGVDPPPSTPSWRVRLRRVGTWGGATALCLSLPFLFSTSTARLALRAGKFDASPEVEELRTLVDIDGDGFSPLLGGGDCDDLDRDIHPFGRDDPDDGVDQDCDGVDDWVDETPPIANSTGSPEAPAGLALRERARGKNVLVVLIDAMRFDRLKSPSRFPRLGALWRESLSFSRALAPAAATRQVLPSIFDGTHRPGAGSRLFHEVRAAGGQTGVVALDVVIDQVELVKELGGDAELVGISTEGKRSLWGGGVHVFTGHAITEAALGWLDTRVAPDDSDAPWLLWTHYFSAHQWDSIDAIKSVTSDAERYDAALADDDRAVGDLLDGLAARGLSESTMVVLLADHGESVGDHGWRTHGSYLYPELVHVPMGIRIPGVTPRTISTPVPTTALTPTLLDLVGVAHPRADSLDSLVPLVSGGSAAPHPIVMREKLQDAILLGDRVLRYTPDANATELFALEDFDAPSPENLVAREPETVRRMSRMLASALSE
jgi:hypothetical protein